MAKKEKMNKKAIYMVAIVFGLLLLLFLITKLFYHGEDGWVRDSDGLWLEHGNPTTIPDEVKAQYDAILCGFALYSNEKVKNVTFDSQCIGTCQSYAVDIVNVPRTPADDLADNQCIQFLSGNVSNLIEVDKNAEIVRIVD